MSKRSSTRKPPVPLVAEVGVARVWIVLAAAVLLELLVGIGVGASWGLAVYRLLVDGTVLLIWLGAMLGIGAWGLRIIGLGEVVAPVATSVALGIGVTSLVCLGLSLPGWLNRGSGWSLVGGGAVAGVFWVTDWRRDRDFSVSAFMRRRISRQNWLWLLVIPFLAASLVGALIPPGALWGQNEPNGYDVVEYHLQVPREWFDAGRMIPLHHNVFSFFPFNVELHYLLAMHLRGGPWAGMYLAQFMHLAMITLTVVALFEMIGRGGMLGVLLAATTPWLMLLGSIAFDEGGVLLFGTLAVGWMIDALRRAQLSKRRIALAGFLAGFACGCKWSCVPMLLGVLPVGWVICRLLAQSPHPNPPPQAGEGKNGGGFAGVGAGTAIFLFAALLVLSPWLIRNYSWSGNPVFPEGMKFLGQGYFSPEQVARWDNAYRPPVGERDVGHRVAALWPQIFGDWRFGFVLIPAAGLAVVAAIRRKNQFDSRMLFLLLLAIGWLVFWLGFTHLQGRFMVLLIPVAAMLIARIEQPIGKLTLLCGLLLQVGLAAVIFFQGSLSGAPNSSTAPAKMLEVLQPTIGWETYSWASRDAEAAAKAKGDICLIGDAKAFLYQVPSSRLHYRTVFDVDVKGRDIIDAWGEGCPQTLGELVFVDYGELVRFHRTYGTPLPAVMPTTSASEKP